MKLEFSSLEELKEFASDIGLAHICNGTTEQTPEPAVKVVPKKKATQKKKVEPVVEEPVVEEPVVEEPVVEAVTHDDLINYAKENCKDNVQPVKDMLANFNVKKISDIPADKCAEALATLKG